VGGRFYCGRAVIALSLRHALPTLQRRRMPELRVVAHRGIDIDDTRFPDEGIAADLDRADVDEVRLSAITENDRVLAQDSIVADRNHVCADRAELAADHGVAADPRA